MLVPLFLTLLAVDAGPSPAAAGSAPACFSRTFCSTGEAPRFILCGRGQDCTSAPDLGLQFQADCRVSRWLGDAQQTRPYTVEGDVVTIVPNEWETHAVKEVFRLSKRGEFLTSAANAKHVFSAKACKAVK